jgi:catechol 2,3-dioxygenase-like lactoylglutathione lyase family enzyme
MRVLSVVHCCVSVPDLEDAIGFFRDILGFDLTGQGVHDPAVFGPFALMDEPDVPYAVVTCPDGTEVELLEYRNPRGRQRDTRRLEDVGISVLTLEVDDVEGLMQRLSDAGYPPFGELMPWGGPDEKFLAVHVHGPGDIPVTIGQRIRTPQGAGLQG